MVTQLVIARVNTNFKFVVKVVSLLAFWFIVKALERIAGSSTFS